MPKPWLIGIHRRTLKDVKYRLMPSQVFSLITSKEYPYRVDSELYCRRDRAYLSLLYLSGGRVNEVLRVLKQQFDLESDPDFIIVRNFYVSKRKEETLKRFGVLLREVPMPRRGPLSKFTNLVLDYLPLVKGGEERLFKFGRRRGWQITKYVTGMWNHWFRAQCLSYVANLIKNPYAVAQMMGIENVNTIMWYFTGTWQDYRSELLGGRVRI